jgi:hypothetical protein
MKPLLPPPEPEQQVALNPQDMREEAFLMLIEKLKARKVRSESKQGPQQ